MPRTNPPELTGFGMTNDPYAKAAQDNDYKRDDERTPFKSFEDLTSNLLRVPKKEVDEKRAERKKKRRQEETS
jgi:hypothetical protein